MISVGKKNTPKLKRVKGQKPKKVDYDTMLGYQRVRNRMKKRSPSYGQNGQLVHWWVLVHSGHFH
jgi:hypothetical protein